MNKILINNCLNITKAFFFIIIGALLSYLFINSKPSPVATLQNFNIPNYGKYDNSTAKYLILFPLKAIANPDNKIWSMNQTLGYGLFGVSLLDTEDYVAMLGYKSFFLGGSDVVGIFGVSSKFEATYKNSQNIFLINTDLSIAQTKSIISKREAVIYGTAFGLTDRYTYRKSSHKLIGNDEQFHVTESNKQLKNLLIQGDQVFNELKKLGYEDLTLKYALGVLNSSLTNDGINVENISESKFGPSQVYRDALNGTLIEYVNEPYLDDLTFMKILTGQLNDRGFDMLDQAFSRKDDNGTNTSVVDDTHALVKIVEDDLSNICK